MKNIDRLFSKINNTTPGCSICVIKNDRIIMERSYGLADVEKNTQITSNTPFRLASITKTFTAMAIMILKEREKINFDDQIKKFYPDFPTYGKNITIRQLLTHTSGLPDHEGPLRSTLYIEPTIYNAFEVFKSQKKTYFKPGARYKYSDAGYVLLALIIEKVTKEKYALFLDKNIFKPLKMKNSFVLDETKPKRRNKALGYIKTNSGYQIYDYDPLNYIVGDEGIYSSVSDLAKWQTAWQGNGLVKKSILDEALTRQQINKKRKGRCGFSWFIEEKGNRKIIFHDGYWVGFNNIIYIDLKTNITAIILSNTTMFPTEQRRLQIAKEIIKYTLPNINY